MEFKYREGQDPPPPSSVHSYSTTIQPLQGRFRGSEMRSRDRLRREMKEQIREEITAMRREIEDEVMMEMAIEREISLRAEAARLSSSSSSQPLGFQRSLQRTVGLPVLTQQRLLEREGLDKPVPVLVGRNVWAVTGKGVSVEGGVSSIDLEIGDKEEALLCKSSTNNAVAGSKRKADLIGKLELANPKKVHNDWSCPLCQISTTCERGLNDHLKGKKHKARERVLVEKSIAASNGQDSSNNTEWEKKPQQVCTIEAQKPVVSILRCDYCNVLCSSELAMADHLRGKKHVAWTSLLQKPVEGLGGTIPSITMSMKSEDEVMRAENMELRESFDSKVEVDLGGAAETKEEVAVVDEVEVVNGVEEEAKMAVAALQEDVETESTSW